MIVVPSRTFAALLISTVAIGLAAACGSSPAAPGSVPAVPQITAPTEGQVFSNFPRTMTVTWNAVTSSAGPVTYKLDIQVMSAVDSTKVVEDMNDDNDAAGCQGSITGTTCTFEFPGMNPGRIRIQAVDAKGNASAFSAFVDFTYTV